MTGINRHIIEKQFVELNLINSANAFEIRNELEYICKNELLPQIEKMFDKLIPENKILRLDNLEINAGTIASDNWKNDLLEIVIREISVKIEELKTEERYSAEETNTFIRSENNAQNIFFYFLENGTLPWHSGISSRAELNSLTGELMRTGDENFLNKMKDLLRDKSNSLNRLIHQTDENELKRISGLLFNEEYQSRILSMLNSALVNLNINYSQRKEILYRSWFEIHLGNYHGMTESELLLKTSLLISGSLHLEKGAEMKGSFINNLTDQLKNKKYSEDILKSIKEFPVKEIKISGSGKGLNTGYEFYINNSGLILIHPFLLKLFENAGYAENNKWISKELQQRAIALTQYIVTGNEEYPEFLLMLNKVMCGYEIPESLPSDIELSEFEKNEADDLLNSVTGHWKALRNTSVNGLRETFLMRNGKLTEDNNGWLLQVEDKTVDILLNKIPWGVSMIKLPWMDKILRVEWN
ncbi:MAG TPA: contractile injection system tape measure protein [Ignavibacteria bacterium]|nr:contractile injection system tape measure protein [Ignavibacteria bacterium]